MVHILKREHTRLRVKAVDLPISTSPVLGDGIDVTKMPDGHLSCSQCQGFKFECWVYLDAHRLECGCLKCGWSCRLLFPIDVDLMAFGKSGRFTCMRRSGVNNDCFAHKDLGMIIIHSGETISIGCEKCRTEVDIKVKSKSNLVLA